MSRPSRRRATFWAAALTIAAFAGPPRAAAQGITASQLEQLRNNPDLIRQRIQESGLSAAEIRQRLRAAGYPATLLDEYLSGAGESAVRAPDQTQMSALRALGLPFAMAEQLLGLDTGFVRGRSDSVRSRVFGVDTFRRSTTQFLPLLSGPVPPDYRLGPGDVLVLILTGDVEFSYTLPVSREGFVVIPQVGQLFVANLSLDQLRDLLFARLGRAYSGVRRGAGATTQFDVSVANVRANQVYVVGEVTQPGAYQISALGTVLTALYAAGGVTEQANLRRLELRRHGEVAATLDLYDYLLQGDARGDVRLETGDVIFVGVHGPRVEVSGAVVREGIFEVHDGEQLADLLRAAGGFHARAARERVMVHRVLPVAERGPGPAPRAAIDLRLAVDGDSVLIPPFALRDGDSVVIDALQPLAATYSVTVHGYVTHPGTFPWREGMTLRDLVSLAGGPRVGADLREAEVARMPEDRSNGALARVFRVPLDSSYLAARDAAGRYVGPPGPAFPAAGASPDVPLEPYDRVLILRQPEFETQRTVQVAGEVRYPGAYALERKDERLTDLIARAGGLLPTAYPEGGRLIREVEDAGRVNIELAAALRDPGGRRDIMLQPGDSLQVPEYVPTVRVVGAVNSPTSVLFREGAGVGYYIDNAGGWARDADKGRVAVRYANGTARVPSKFLFFARSYPTPGPGSVITVPDKPAGEPFNLTGFMAAFAQILASTVAIIVIATR
jgi:protein involved in polysaccharide export with SLBB domain